MLRKLLPRQSASRWLGSQTELELERHFEIVKKLGKGSYAVVFAARKRDDGQLYALKVADIAALGPLEQADVVNEIRLLASLSHPNLTTFYEAFCDHGKLCIVQELVGGGDISTLIKKRAANSMHFNEAQVWATILQIALGLQYLHHNHVLHRDLKPKNILITPTGLVKLADLGISQQLDRVFTDAMIGTPHYMAPEMWRRQPYSYSADVWALGCILHELCTLRPLFLAPIDEETRQKVLSGAVPPLPARYSEELRSLVRGMLQQAPAARPTIDDILQTPAAQRQLALLPEALRERCISPALSEGSLARLLGPIQVPQQASDWDRINDLFPPPRYPSGSGVSSALRSKSKKGSWSTGDLQALAAEAQAEAAGDAAASPFGSPAPGASLAAPPPPPASEAEAAMRKVQSYGSLSAAVQAQIERSSSSLTRRKTLGVGEPLPLLAGEGGRRGSTSGGAAGRRCASQALQPVAEEAGSSSGSPPAGAMQPPKPSVGGGCGQAKGAPVAARSKSLSVEDALEVLASGGSLPGMPNSKRQQGQPATSGAYTVATPLAPAPGAAAAAAAPLPPSAPRPIPAAGGPAGSSPAAPVAAAAPGSAPASVLLPGPPLASPPVTADVRVGAGGILKPAVPETSAAVPAAQQEGQQQGQESEEAGKKAGKPKAHFWQRAKGKH